MRPPKTPATFQRRRSGSDAYWSLQTHSNEHVAHFSENLSQQRRDTLTQFVLALVLWLLLCGFLDTVYVCTGAYLTINCVTFVRKLIRRAKNLSKVDSRRMHSGKPIVKLQRKLPQVKPLAWRLRDTQNLSASMSDRNDVLPKLCNVKLQTELPQEKPIVRRLRGAQSLSASVPDRNHLLPKLCIMNLQRELTQERQEKPIVRRLRDAQSLSVSVPDRNDLLPRLCNLKLQRELPQRKPIVLGAPLVPRS